MARTLNVETHAVRREAFVEVGQRLVQTVGYERMSIQDVLDGVGASRGAFYHYFDGKAALLDAVVERMIDDAWSLLERTVDDPSMSAVEKLQQFFTRIAAWKWERRDAVLRLLDVWLSDDNAVVREHFRRRTGARVRPLFVRILTQGRDEGTMRIASPDATARSLAALLLAINEAATELFMEFQAGATDLDAIEDVLVGFFEGFERIAGMEPGTIAAFERGIMRQWFG